MSEEKTRKKPVSPEILFRIVAEEAFKDGVLEGWEAKILQLLAKFLGISRDQALEIARHAKRLHAEGKLGEERPLKPSTLYRKVLYFICSDGHIGETEGQMLLALRQLFKISEDEHARHLHQVAMHFRRRSDVPEASTAPPPAEPEPDAIDEEAERILEGARELSRQYADQNYSEDSAPRMQALFAELREALEPRRGQPRPLLEAFAMLTPALAQEKRSKDVVAFLADTIQPADLWAEHPDLYQRVMATWPVPLIVEGDPERARGLVETSWRLAQLEPVTPHRWAGFGQTLFQVLKDLASRSDWERHVGFLELFHQVPDDQLPSVAGPWAEAAADWVVLGLHDGKLYAVDRGLQELKLLASYRDQPTVRRAEATALGCIIQTCADEGATEESYLLRALQRARELVDFFPDDAELARPLVLASQTAGKALIRLDQADACIDLFDNLSDVAGRHGSDEDLAFDIAKAVVGSAMTRARRLGSPSGDPVLTALESAMARVAAACPASALVHDAQKKLGAVLGHSTPPG